MSTYVYSLQETLELELKCCYFAKVGIRKFYLISLIQISWTCITKIPLKRGKKILTDTVGLGHKRLLLVDCAVSVVVLL